MNININRLFWYSSTLFFSRYDIVLKNALSFKYTGPCFSLIQIIFHIRPREAQASTYAFRFIAFLFNKQVTPVKSRFKYKLLPYGPIKRFKYATQHTYSFVPDSIEVNLLLSFLLFNFYLRRNRLKITCSLSNMQARLVFHQFNVFAMRTFLSVPNDRDWNHKLNLIFYGKGYPSTCAASFFKLFKKHTKIR
jgi:hypothetical protein